MESKVAGENIFRGRNRKEAREIKDIDKMAAIDIITQRILPNELKSTEWGIKEIRDPLGNYRLNHSANSVTPKLLINLFVFH